MYLVLEVPQSDGGVLAGGDADLFGGMGRQTPDSPPSVAVQQQVARRVLLPDLDDLSVLRPHQDLTLRKRRRRRRILLSFVHSYSYDNENLKSQAPPPTVQHNKRDKIVQVNKIK